MRPSPDRNALGWTAAARMTLAMVAIIFGSALAWASRHPRPAQVPLPTLSVDANTAPVPVLGALPGLGPVLAGRIVEARPFRSIDDFDRRVRGIGPAKIAALRPFLRFDRPDSPIP